MGWRKIGDPYEVTVAGQRVICKPMTDGDRLAFAKRIVGLKDDASSDNIYDMVTECIMSLPGLVDDGDPVEIRKHLSYQPITLPNQLITEILRGGSLSEEESKNSDSSPKQQPSISTNSDEDV